MTIFESIEKTFNEKKINYFKGNNSSDNIFNLPYRGILKPKNHINIYMEVNEELRIITFTFLEKAKNGKDDVTIKTKLLDLNAILAYGALSMRSDSDTIEYRIDYQLNDDDFSFDQYNRYIVRCIKVYEKLQEDEIIK